MIHFTSWSASTTAADSANQRQVLGMQPRLARPAQVALAAPAQPFAVDVVAIVPAALAFLLSARFHLYPKIIRAMQARRRSQHHEFEVVPEAREQLVVLAAGVEIDLGLERRADLAFAAQELDILSHRIAQLAQAAPFRE